jgi:hypothetical protein
MLKDAIIIFWEWLHIWCNLDSDSSRTFKRERKRENGETKKRNNSYCVSGISISSLSVSQWKRRFAQRARGWLGQLVFRNREQCSFQYSSYSYPTEKSCRGFPEAFTWRL